MRTYYLKTGSRKPEIRFEISRRAYGKNKKKQGENSSCVTLFVLFSINNTVNNNNSQITVILVPRLKRLDFSFARQNIGTYIIRTKKADNNNCKVHIRGADDFSLMAIYLHQLCYDWFFLL